VYLNRKSFPNVEEWLNCDGKQDKKDENLIAVTSSYEQEKYFIECYDKSVIYNNLR
jgi:hypothetical protein